jgi:lipoic acid synthetase
MHHEVMEFVKPEQFLFYKEKGLEMGFKYVESGPMVRSSYHAEKHVF